VRQFEIVALSHEDKVQIVGDKVMLDSDYVSRTYDMHDERRRADALMYVLHELIHLDQGIGAKSTVRRLRRAGGEHSLLHADLSADHVAAALLHHLAPRWSTAFLTDVQGSSLASFPSTGRHTKAALHRKRLRLLALRTDYWVQRLGLLPERSTHGYVYVEHTKAKDSQKFGDLSVLLSGPPVSVIGTTRLNPTESAALERVSLPSNPLPLSELDEVLVRTLRRLQPTANGATAHEAARSAIR